MWTSESPFNQSPPQPHWIYTVKHDQPRAYYESRGNGATEKKGAQICTSIFLKEYLGRNILLFSSSAFGSSIVSKSQESKFCFNDCWQRHQIDIDQNVSGRAGKLDVPGLQWHWEEDSYNSRSQVRLRKKVAKQWHKKKITEFSNYSIKK